MKLVTCSNSFRSAESFLPKGHLIQEHSCYYHTLLCCHLRELRRNTSRTISQSVFCTTVPQDVMKRATCLIKWIELATFDLRVVEFELRWR